jgi:nucleoside-diphosphate-sugar epimerase
VATRILVTGSSGQIGTELVPRLRALFGADNVVAADQRAPSAPTRPDGPFVMLDTGNLDVLMAVAKDHGIDTIYHLAALLSAKGEMNPRLAWEDNMEGLWNVLEVARTSGVRRVFWPSSIAAFGPDVPRTNTPQDAPLNPTTIYGVTKVAGELLCNYFFLKFGVDVRSLRFPGLISDALPGGGTTDYAVEMFYAALREGSYTCFLREDTVLPMMYMPDAIQAAVMLMGADPGHVPRHTGYNLSGVSFSAGELAAEIRRHVPTFKVTYSPDSRQKIADSWPKSVDDSLARKDWGWKHDYDLPRMVTDLLSKLEPRLAPERKDV